MALQAHSASPVHERRLCASSALPPWRSFRTRPCTNIPQHGGELLNFWETAKTYFRSVVLQKVDGWFHSPSLIYIYIIYVCIYIYVCVCMYVYNIHTRYTIHIQVVVGTKTEWLVEFTFPFKHHESWGKNHQSDHRRSTPDLIAPPADPAQHTPSCSIVARTKEEMAGAHLLSAAVLANAFLQRFWVSRKVHQMEVDPPSFCL